MGPYANYYRQTPNNFSRPRPGGRPQQNDRLVGGGFLGPFILGGITGGLVAPFFYGGYSRPNYYYPQPYYPPYYRPYYRPY